MNNKLIKQIIPIAVIIVLSFLITYLLGSFIAGSFDIMNWNIDDIDKKNDGGKYFARFVYLLITIPVAASLVMFYDLEVKE